MRCIHMSSYFTTLDDVDQLLDGVLNWEWGKNTSYEGAKNFFWDHFDAYFPKDYDGDYHFDAISEFFYACLKDYIIENKEDPSDYISER